MKILTSQNDEILTLSYTESGGFWVLTLLFLLIYGFYLHETRRTFLNTISSICIVGTLIFFSALFFHTDNKIIFNKQTDTVSFETYYFKDMLEADIQTHSIKGVSDLYLMEYEGEDSDRYHINLDFTNYEDDADRIAGDLIHNKDNALELPYYNSKEENAEKLLDKIYNWFDKNGYFKNN